MPDALYSDQLTRLCARFEHALPGFLPKTGGRQTTVCEAMGYACKDGGKRLRPVLLLAFCRLCGGDTEAALPFAAAIEMIHSYSLVHDDLPCMDNSLMRRGRPSTHAVYGETMALLAGDALLTRAFEVMLRPDPAHPLPPEHRLAAAAALADAAGADGMVGGQVIDLQSEGKQIGRDDLEALQEGKTAALIAAACVMGVCLAGGDDRQRAAARAYGHAIGLGFQIVDDILDVTATPETLGKPVGSDAQNEKVTYVSLLGIDGARQLAAQHTRQALSALDAFDGQTASLRQLAEALLTRDH